VIRYAKTKWLKEAYQAYATHKQTLEELSTRYQKSTRTLQRAFDKLNNKSAPTKLFSQAINLIFDGTFFSRADGILVFRARQKNLHWQFIESETLKEINVGLEALDKQGYAFSSFTIDGRKGVIQLLKARYPAIPIQLCQFHQAQIIRRYLTNNPKTLCGRELKSIVSCLTKTTHDVFQSLVETAQEKWADFLKEKNEQNQFKHRHLRSAFRSLKSNMPYLFTYKQFPELNIPNTTNSCDGSFAHWKQKVKIHRGLRKERRNQMVDFLLTQT
jgi:hypothetical protein